MSERAKSPRAEVLVRQARRKDIPGILAVARAAYAAWPQDFLADERNYEMQLRAFPDGQNVALVGGKIVGYCTSLIVRLQDDAPWFAHAEITGYGSFNTHDPSGDTLYGADIAVHPDWQGKGISSRLYQVRKALLKRFNLRQMVAGGRIPGYVDYKGAMSAQDYVTAVIDGRLHDPALNAHLRAGYQVGGVHFGYIQDEQSLGWATHLVMPNKRFRAKRRAVAAAPIRRPARKMRVCAVQYEQRRISGWDDLVAQVEYFVDTADMYDCHLLVFPEVFTAQMFSAWGRELTLSACVERLAALHADYLAMFTRLARAHGLYIVGGSVPVRRDDGRLYNVAHLFSPGGEVHTQDKLHVTPNEQQWWGISPGHGLSLFETPYGRLAILICYDSEFPELSRMLVDAGADVIIVPFSTDERKAYQRVRSCCAARAVENAVYVVLAGNVGGLPHTQAMALNFGQAAVLTPSDFSFPMNAILAEGVVNTQTVVIADLDLSSLEHSREHGTVRPLVDRRHDIYGLISRTPVTRVRVS
jgi:predicted amidohydrolase/GNAT superfamily N-acetyltransferase